MFKRIHCALGKMGVIIINTVWGANVKKRVKECVSGACFTPNASEIAYVYRLLNTDTTLYTLPSIYDTNVTIAKQVSTTQCILK